MNNTVYNKIKKKGIGPGGFYCACCTDFPPTLQKRKDSRKVRKILKQQLRKQYN